MSRPMRLNAQYSYVEPDGRTTTVMFAPSECTDGALVVYLDTNYEPNGSDGSHGLRVRVNDANVTECKPGDFVAFDGVLELPS